LFSTPLSILCERVELFVVKEVAPFLPSVLLQLSKTEAAGNRVINTIGVFAVWLVAVMKFVKSQSYSRHTFIESSALGRNLSLHKPPGMSHTMTDLSSIMGSRFSFNSWHWAAGRSSFVVLRERVELVVVEEFAPFLPSTCRVATQQDF
jgi:hypothetical protein